MLLSQKIELRPTIAQIDYLNQACGSKRHCYNQLLAHFSQEGVKWSKKEARQQYKRIRATFDFYKEVTQRATSNTIDDLDNAYKHFFRRVKSGEKPGYPRFKRKGVADSFALRDSTKFNIDCKLLRIERLGTKIKMRQPQHFTGTNKHVTITKRAGKFFASILTEVDDYSVSKKVKQDVVGVDMGIKSLAVCSNGKVFENNHHLNNSLDKLKKLQKSLSRKMKGSNRRVRAKLKVAKLHYRVSNQRADMLHNISSYLTKKFSKIVIEDLGVKGMMKNHNLARSISDVGWGMLRTQLEYKSKIYGNELVIANRFYPSSKTCSDCGTIKEHLTLNDRTFVCESCGLEIDRDDNASQNLKQYSEDTFKPTKKRTKETDKTSFTSKVADVVNNTSINNSVYAMV